MIHCLLIKISYTSRGLPVRSYHTLTGDEIVLGRSAECRIHLPDPRVAMHHAVIKRLDDGQLHIVSVNGEIEVDGALHQNVPLTTDARIMVGPYQLDVEPAPPDVDLALSLVLAHRLPDDYDDLKSRTLEPLLGASRFKRRLALGLVTLIALAGLVLPFAQIFSPSLQKVVSDWPFGFDRIWSAGRISTAHQNIGTQCMECHRRPGHQVSDQACTACHRDTAPHIADPALQRHAFVDRPRFSGGMRCAECHREHKAPLPLVKQDNGTCIECHADIKTVHASTTLPDIHDFDRDHPEFKLTFRTGPGPQQVERILQSDKARLVEHSGLKFPHEQHVGMVQGPNGLDDIRTLSCTTCHVPVGKEMRFQAISFKRDCLTCHADRLEVGPPEATLRMPHGDETSVMNALRLHAPKQVEPYSATLKKDGCAYCHETQPAAAGDPLPWRTMPLTINDDWFSKARFNHASHHTQPCKSCHDVENSQTSADVAMPDRDSCLRCHAGNERKYKRIASSCMSCHDFHNAHGGQGGVVAGSSVRPEDAAALHGAADPDAE